MIDQPGAIAERGGISRNKLAAQVLDDFLTRTRHAGEGGAEVGAEGGRFHD